jgi:D-alanyl-D-alanine carboxypeptidase/D-alanyl-D-alanine-endopeptidase (penicillin-binding protein 4)
LIVDFPRLSGKATVRVVDANGSHVFSVGMDKPMVPASTMKIITATNALTTLGAGHRFTTKVVDGGRRNDIILVGGGDPLLDRTSLRRLATRTKQHLVSTGRGGRAMTVRLDDTLYPAPSDAMGWLPGDSPTYAAPVRALGMLYDYSSDTATNAAAAFVDALNAVGVTATFGGRRAASTGAAGVASVSPHTVGGAIKIMLIYSENNIAEQLFRHVALATGNEPTWQGARQAARDILRSLRVPVRGAALLDGSGLSMDNRLTARTLTMALRLQVDGNHPELSQIVDKSWLPTAGETGTLANRFWAYGSDCAVGQVFAKTGSLSGVQTLAGLTRGVDGDWKIFAVLVNDAYGDARPVIDEMAAEINGCLAA